MSDREHYITEERALSDDSLTSDEDSVALRLAPKFRTSSKDDLTKALPLGPSISKPGKMASANAGTPTSYTKGTDKVYKHGNASDRQIRDEGTRGSIRPDAGRDEIRYSIIQHE